MSSSRRNSQPKSRSRTCPVCRKGPVVNGVKTRGLNPRHNSTLKGIFKGAATTVITKLTNDPLPEHYERVLKQGTKPNLAKLTIARKIAEMALSMCKTREVYNPARQLKQQLTLASGQQPLQ